MKAIIQTLIILFAVSFGMQFLIKILSKCVWWLMDNSGLTTQQLSFLSISFLGMGLSGYVLSALYVYQKTR